MPKKVALLVGGWSAEREVSLNKGKAIEGALKEGGYDVKVVDVTRDIQKLISELTPKPDVVFNNLYGRGGEDGVIQGILEALEIPYTHSDVTASAIGMDKPMAKILAASVGVKSADGRVASKEEVLAETVMDRPYVVKPLNEGSSVGVRIILEGENQKPLDEESWVFGEEVLVEKFVEGREIHVTVLDGKAQGVTEIKFPGRFFDYDAKYSDKRTELVTPADVPEDVAAAAMYNAEAVFKVLGCSGLARCDFRYDVSKSGKDAVYFLEINTMPGLAPGSVALIQPEHNGMSFVQLCTHLVETAKCHGSVKAREKEKAASSNDAALLQSA
ncbi:MAG TPA: D-alanine--D-alanine ligase [Alphaproteobacteria bacterium]|nr:D-alanine--D-alanine ligase [Alphaproteobacteria bacterium]